MNKKRTILSLLIGALLIFSSASSVFAASSNGLLIKEYEFTTKDTSSIAYEADEKIKEDGKTYKLVSTDYEIIKDNKVAVTKTVKTNDKAVFDETVEYILPSGETIILKAKSNIEWRDNVNRVIKTQEYKSESNIPQIIKSTRKNAEGETITIELERSSIDKKQRVESFSAPAVFTAPYLETTKYSFNGEIVTITGEPKWSGYESDVKVYLGINGNEYNITGGSWNGEAVYDGEKYTRKAIYTGTKTVPLYVATFTETDATAELYEADITYEGIDGEATVKAICTYEEHGLSTAAKAIVGVLLLAGLIVLILYILSRRKNKEESEA